MTQLTEEERNREVEEIIRRAEEFTSRINLNSTTETEIPIPASEGTLAQLNENTARSEPPAPSVINELDDILSEMYSVTPPIPTVDVPENLLFENNEQVETPTPEPEVEIEEEIPVNSPSLLISDTTSRFSSAEWYEGISRSNITLAGLGGIGSYVAFLLARLNPSALELYDFDRVEAVNMSGQLYSTNDIGNTKLFSIIKMVNSYSDFYRIIGHEERFTETSHTYPITICGFDNMESRRITYEKWKEVAKEFPEDSLFIDGRLAAEEFQVFCIQGTDERAMELYEKDWLFADSEAEETLCSYKQTTFMANMIGSIMVNLFVNFIANKAEPLFPRDIPFLTEYDASRMYFKVEM